MQPVSALVSCEMALASRPVASSQAVGIRGTRRDLRSGKTEQRSGAPLGSGRVSALRVGEGLGGVIGRQLRWAKWRGSARNRGLRVLRPDCYGQMCESKNVWRCGVPGTTCLTQRWRTPRSTRGIGTVACVRSVAGATSLPITSYSEAEAATIHRKVTKPRIRSEAEPGSCAG